MERIYKTEYRFTKSEIKEALVEHFGLDDVIIMDCTLELENGKEYKHHGYLTVFPKE